MKNILSYPAQANIAGFDPAAALSGRTLAHQALNLPAGDYEFIYDYPLSEPVRFVHALDHSKTLADLISRACFNYQRIYKENDSTASPDSFKPPIAKGGSEGVVRGASNGMYGVWGHHIESLWIEYVNVDVIKREVRFEMRVFAEKKA